MNDMEEKRKALDEFANSGAQPNQPTTDIMRPASGHALVRPTQGISERIVGAQQVAVYRDEGKIFQKLSTLAAAAGSDWFYRFPVRNTQTGQQDWIEGPSIKLANDVARIFGNNVNEVREIDTGDSWTFYARFTDIETGFSMERAYHQRKSQRGMRADSGRALDINYQIGQSKAIRNCITNALQLYCDFAFEEARNSLVSKIGKDIDGWRARTLEGVTRMGCDLNRVERVIGRSAKAWLAPDIARVIAMMKAVADGMATIDETFPAVTEGAPTPAAEQAKTVRAADTSAEKTNESQTETESGTTEGETAGAETSTENQQAAPASQQVEARLTEAFQKGRADHAKGMQRKAVPLEYRAKEATALAQAWWQGWDTAEAEKK